MAEKHEKEGKLNGHLTGESVRVVAESVGIGGLPDTASAYLAEDCTYRIKQIVQEAMKLMNHSKRNKLTCSDFDNALRVANVEPLYGFHAPDLVPFRYASGGGRELHFTDDKELDLQEVINSSLPKVPLEISMKAHWLCIDGEQPAIPENPPPASKDQQKQEILDTSVKAMIDKSHKPAKPTAASGRLPHKPKGVSDLVKMKELSVHELSVEQQLYYKEITEACVGSDEMKRSEALQSLATDPGLHQMLPHFTSFISEGVKVNVVQNNLALLIYLMRMMKALMENHTIYLEKYLHEFIPGVVSCIVSKQLCMRPDVDNHWALRDFAARLNAQICKNFHNNVNNIQARITKTFSKAVRSEKAALATIYGALSGLGELGAEVINAFVLPNLRMISERVRTAIEGPMTNSADRIAAENIKKIATKYIPPVLKTHRPATDSVEDYMNDFGYLGPLLHAAVSKERTVSTSSISLQQKPSIQITQGKPQLVIGQTSVQGSAPPTPTSKIQQPGIGIPRTPSTPNIPGNPAQKFIIMQQRPGTPVQSSGTSLVKMLPGMQTVTSGVPQTSTPGQKIVVMSLPQSMAGSQTIQEVQGVSSDMGMKTVFTTGDQLQTQTSVIKSESNT
ncbi:Transcription initiation factor TFIID subunit 6 [Mactra antiquata]